MKNIWEYVNLNDPKFKLVTEKVLRKSLVYYKNKYGFSKTVNPSVEKTEYHIKNIYPQYKKDKWYIFVSSTFQDMQLERDILKRKVLPRVNDYAKQYGNTVEFIDLRWGIDSSSIGEEEKKNRKILKSCFDEIDKSRPLFIGFLGNRYGWIPPDSILDDLTSSDMIEKLRGQSVTAMEIEYGAFSNSNCDALFFFRNLSGKENADSSLSKRCFEEGDAAERLEKLKNRILASDNTSVSNYNAMIVNDHIEVESDFDEILYKEIIKTLEKQWEKQDIVNDCTETHEWIEQVSYIRQLSSNFVERTELLDDIKAFVSDNDAEKQVLLLNGVSGSGKSSLVCKLADDLKDQMPVCFVSCGRTEFTNDTNKILKLLIWELSETLGINENINSNYTFDELREEFFDRLWKLNETVDRALIIVDALDQLIESRVGNELNWIIGEIPPNIKIICTSINDLKSSVRGKFEALYWQVDNLLNSESKQIINAILKKNHKELASEVIDSITESSDESVNINTNPLYLTMVINDLCMMDRYDFEKISEIKKSGNTHSKAVNIYILNRIKALGDNPAAAYDGILDHMDSRIGNDFVFTLVSIIASSRYGINEIAIEEIMRSVNVEYDAADFAFVRNVISDHMILTNNGCWDFSHSIMRKALFSNRKDKILEINNSFICFLENNISDPYSQKEIVHHYFLAEDYEKALNLLLSDIKYSDSVINSLIYELIALSQNESAAKEDFFERFEKWVLDLKRKDLQRLSVLFRKSVVPNLPASLSAIDKARIMNVIIKGLNRYEPSEECEESLFEEVMEPLTDALTDSMNDSSASSFFKGLGLIILGVLTSPFRMIAEIISLTFSGRKQFISECIFANLDCAPLCIDSGDLEKADDYISDAIDYANWFNKRSLGNTRFRLLALAYINAGRLMMLSPKGNKHAISYYRYAAKSNLKWYRRTRNKEALYTMIEVCDYSINEFNMNKASAVGVYLSHASIITRKISRRSKSYGVLYDAKFLKKCAETSIAQNDCDKAREFYELEHKLRQHIYSDNQDFESEWEMVRSESDLIKYYQDDKENSKWDLYGNVIVRMENLLKKHSLDLDRQIVLNNLRMELADYLESEAKHPGYAINAYEYSVKQLKVLNDVKGSDYYIPFAVAREKSVYSLLEAYYAIEENVDVIDKLCDLWTDLCFIVFDSYETPDITEYLKGRLLFVSSVYDHLGQKDKSLSLLERMFEKLNRLFVPTLELLIQSYYDVYDFSSTPVAYFELSRKLVELYFESKSYEKIEKMVESITNNINRIKRISAFRNVLSSLSSLSELTLVPAEYDRVIASYIIFFNDKTICDENLEHYDGTLDNGLHYCGDVYLGVFHGEGTLELDGDICSGHFDCNTFTGEGYIKHSDGKTIKGNFIDYEMNGFCSIDYTNGNHYEGLTRNDKREGKGIMRFKNDDSVYEGHYYRGIPNGYGIYKNSDGNIIEEGFYRDSKICSKHRSITVDEI